MTFRPSLHAGYNSVIQFKAVFQPLMLIATGIRIMTLAVTKPIVHLVSLQSKCRAK